MAFRGEKLIPQGTELPRTPIHTLRNGVQYRGVSDPKKTDSDINNLEKGTETHANLSTEDNRHNDTLLEIPHEELLNNFQSDQIRHSSSKVNSPELAQASASQPVEQLQSEIQNLKSEIFKIQKQNKENLKNAMLNMQQQNNENFKKFMESFANFQKKENAQQTVRQISRETAPLLNNAQTIQKATELPNLIPNKPTGTVPKTSSHLIIPNPTNPTASNVLHTRQQPNHFLWSPPPPLIPNRVHPNCTTVPTTAQIPNDIAAQAVTEPLFTKLVIQDSTDFNFQPFWRQSASQWFELLEQKFANRKIVLDDDKYFNVVKNLQQDLINQLTDVFESLPRGNKYETLKQALLARFIVKEEEKLDRFLNNQDMGHKKPSEFLQYLVANGSSTFDREAILKIWIKRLPVHISVHLDDEITVNNEKKLIDKADNIFNKLQSSTTINSINDPKISDLELKFEQVISQVDKICDSIAEQTAFSKEKYIKYKNRNKENNNRNFENRRARSRSKSPRRRSLSRENLNSQNSLCYYHNTYRHKAHKCQPPCSWKERGRSPSNSKRVAFEKEDHNPKN